MDKILSASSENQLDGPSVETRSLVVKAAFLDASIITIILGVIVFFVLIFASGAITAIPLGPAFWFYRSCLAFGNVNNVSLIPLGAVALFAALLPCLYDLLSRRRQNGVSLGEFLMALGGFSFENHETHTKISRSSLCYLIPSFLSVLTVIMVWQSGQIELVNLEGIYLSAILAAASIVFFASLIYVRLQAKLLELAILGPRKVSKVEYAYFLHVREKRRRDLIVLFAMQIGFALFLYVWQPVYFPVTFPSINLLIVQQLIWFLVGVPLLGAVKFEKTLSLVFLFLFGLPLSFTVLLISTYVLTFTPTR